MRSFLAGLLLVLALTSVSAAQVRGEVESVGFGNGWFRPQCWTPMVVRLQSQISEPAEYRIEVHQRDLDFDHVIYVKEGITLNGQATQRWEVCFLPEPIHGGLPENSIRELQDRLRVYLTNKEGTRQLLSLPVTSPVQSLEAVTSAFGASKAKKLVLMVMDGSSRPALSDSSYDKSVGLVEQPLPVTVRPAALPQSPLAYQSVDAVVWISGDAHALSEQGSKQFAALQQWVRQGGTLIVCQPPSDGDRQKIEPFAEMLPIQWKENGQWKVSVASKPDLEPLLTLAQPKTRVDWGERAWKLKGSFPFARAIARPNAVVDESDWITWDAAGKDRTPYIARMPYGLGIVTWVAEDLGDPTITGPTTAGWPYVWDHVFGWAADTHIPNDNPDSEMKAYQENSYVDLGQAMSQNMEFGAKSAGLIVLAVVFFIIYWIIAGPGSYLFLASRKRKDLSWAVFGVAALGATLLTVLLVRLVLRGNAEVHHASDVRMVSGQEPQPAIAYSRVGLYIPRDGDQRITLDQTSAQFTSYITPMAALPSSNENDFPANMDYTVPVRDEGSAEPVTIDVPFRSTLKKLQAKWCGDISKSIRANSVQLVPHGSAGGKDLIRGTLDNLTGIMLTNVYIAFHAPNGQDYIIYVPSWPAEGPEMRLDLAKLLKEGQLPVLGIGAGNHPRDGKPCWGNIAQQWAPYWHVELARNPTDSSQSRMDIQQGVPLSFPILSLFDRVPPAKNDPNSGFQAAMILRRGARELNMSQAVGAGELVVLAQGDEQPLPFPLQVDGGKVAGEGTVFYQFALPLDHAGGYAPPN